MRFHRILPLALAAAAVVSLGAASRGPGPVTPSPEVSVVTVYKSPSCGCCQKWVDYLQANGFQVKTVDLDDMSEIKAASGVPRALQTCHTAVVEGYVVEGHVPADALKRLLHDRPKVAGLAVPGMPVGSPGMEVPGTPAQSYDIIAWDKAGKTSVFARK
jgi:hypothetical protein